jgi:hypothetical protein
MLEFTKNDGQHKVYINPANVIYFRENAGGSTDIAFNVPDRNGEPHKLLVDGEGAATVKKFRRYATWGF